MIDWYIKRYSSRIEKQTNKPKKEKRGGRAFRFEVCAQWKDGGPYTQGYFSMDRGRDILEAAIRAKSSKGSLGIIENDRTYYCISRRGSLVTRWSTDTGEQPRYPVLLGGTKGSIVREATAIAVDNAKEEKATVGYSGEGKDEKAKYNIQLDYYRLLINRLVNWNEISEIFTRRNFLECLGYFFFFLSIDL